MKTLKILIHPGVNPYYNLALEEYLLSRVPENTVVLYLWQNRHTVVIGRNQNPWAECRTGLLQQEQGFLARRLSGGGAVYHDLGNLNFTFLCREQNYDLQKQLSVIQRACALCGIEAEFSGRNDLLAGGCKFSGNAFFHSKGAAYHHGTLLIDTDLEMLSRYLSPPKAKLSTKGIASVRSRVINLNQLSPGLTCEKMKEHMVEAFCQVYGGQAEPLSLNEQDTAAVEALQKRYESSQWLYGNAIAFSCQLEDHFSWGHLCLQLQVEGGIIREVAAYTDAMDHTLPDQIICALQGCAFQAEAMSQALRKLDVGQDLQSFILRQNL